MRIFGISYHVISPPFLGADQNQAADLWVMNIGTVISKIYHSMNSIKLVLFGPDVLDCTIKGRQKVALMVAIGEEEGVGNIG